MAYRGVAQETLPLIGSSIAIASGAPFAAASASRMPADDDLWMKTVVPLAAALASVTAIALGMYRGSTIAGYEAHRRFAEAMRRAADRLGLQYRPQANALDWAGAIGDHRGRRVALFLVSQTERAMQTGVSVTLRRASPNGLASLAAVRSRKLHIEALATPTGAPGAELRAPTAVQAQSLLEEVDEVQVDSSRIIVLVTGRADFWQGFFEYRMETDVERLVPIVDRSVDLAEALE